MKERVGEGAVIGPREAARIRSRASRRWCGPLGVTVQVVRPDVAQDSVWEKMFVQQPVLDARPNLGG